MTRLSGYPIVFGSESVDLGFIEVIHPGAFGRTLREALDVVALRGHDPNMPLARVSAKTLTVRAEGRGVRAEMDVDERVGYVSDLIHIIDRGDARGGSFAFTALDDLWSLRDGVPYREVLDMRVREVSLGVTFPAYPATRLHVGDLPQARTRSITFARKQLQQAVSR